MRGDNVPVIRYHNSTSIVRTWASRQGYTVGKRGKLPASIVMAYNAANPHHPYHAPF